VVHEFDRLFPIRVFKHNECLVFLPVEPEDDLGIQPLIGAAYATPMHQFARFSGNDLHSAKAIFDNIAFCGAAGCSAAPPPAQAFNRGERVEHFVRFCVDADAVKKAALALTRMLLRTGVILTVVLIYLCPFLRLHHVQLPIGTSPAHRPRTGPAIGAARRALAGR
jgi:hypothetical protein